MMIDLEVQKSLRTCWATESVADSATETITLPVGTIEWSVVNRSATLSVTIGLDATDLAATEYMTLEPGELRTFAGGGGSPTRTVSVKNASGGAVVIDVSATYLGPEASKRGITIA